MFNVADGSKLFYCECVGMHIKLGSGLTMLEIVYDDGDAESIPYEEFKLIEVPDENIFLCASPGDKFEGFDAAVSGRDIVASRREMLRRTDSQKFLDAEKVEIKNMRKNGVFKWIDLPKGERAIRSKFTYRIKRDKDGNIVQYKARLVARGFEQCRGINYLNTSAPVA